MNFWGFREDESGPGFLEDDSKIGFWGDESGMSSEVFKITLAVIIAAAVLAVMASLFGGLWPATQESTEATSGALTNLSQKLKDRISAF